MGSCALEYQLSKEGSLQIGHGQVVSERLETRVIG